VGIGVGLLTWVAPALTALTLLFYIAIWAVGTGVLEVTTAIRLRKQIQHEWFLAVAGFASVAFGVLLMARPDTGALAVAWLIGGYAIVFGIALSSLSFKLRSLAHRLESHAV